MFHIYTRRNTRVQSSAVPSSRSVKLSSHDRQILKILRKSIRALKYCKQMRIQTIKKTVSKGSNATSQLFFRLFIVWYRTYFMKIHSSMFPNSVKIHPGSKETTSPKCNRYFLVWFGVSGKFQENPCFRNVVKKHGFPWYNRKGNSASKGVNITSQKCCRLFLVQRLTYTTNLVKIH